MKRPILWGMVFLIFGCAVTYLYGFAAACILSVAPIMAVIVLYTRLRRLPVLLFLAFYAVGCIRITQSVSPTDEKVDLWVRDGADLRFTGVVEDIAATKTGRARIVLDLRTVINKKEKQTTRLKVMAILPEGETTSPGDTLLMTGVLLPLDRVRNPGGFDEFLYYRAHKIQYKTFSVIEKKAERQRNILATLREWRNLLASVYDSVLPPNEASIIKSVILGDRSDLEQTTLDLYKTAGIYHLLCISGTHISIIGLGLCSLLGLCLNKRAAGLAALIVLIAYCIFTGASVSTVRAVLMSAVVIVGKTIFRESDLQASTAFAAVCLLIYEPLFLMDIGFQLSFSAVFGIAILSAPFDRLLSRVYTRLPVLVFLRRDGVRRIMCASFSAIIGTLPAINYHFYTLTPYAFFVNLIILPTAAALIVFGIAVGITGLAAEMPAVFLSGTLHAILRFYEMICRFFTGLPFAGVLTGSCGVLAAGLAALILLFVRWQSALPQQMKNGRRLFFAAAFAFAIAAGIRSMPSGLTVTMLDVGQGDAFVIRNRGKTFLIDGGGLPNRPMGQNTGATVLLPYLNYLGVNRLDGVFVTHPDRDHIFGILETAMEKPIGKIYLSAAIDQDNAYYHELRRIGVTRDTPFVRLAAGDIIKTDDMNFFVLYPSKIEHEKTAEKTSNETGLVIRLQCRDISILFTGDIDAAVEEELLALQKNALDCSIIKLAHHGSKNGNTTEFLEAVNPRLALVSAGRNNVYGLPAGETTDRLRELKIPLYGTADYGAIILRFNEKKVNVLQTVGES